MSSHSANVRRVMEEERQKNERRGMDGQEGYYGQLTGKVYPSREAKEHYELREAMHRGIDPTQILLEGLSLEQIRALDTYSRRSDKDREDALAMQIAISDFRELHPEFIDGDNCTNGPMMQLILEHSGVKYPTLPQLEEAYQFLRAKGFLHLDQKELNRQAKEEAQERARQIRARGGVAAVAANMPVESEEELERMPLDELRRRANGFGV